MAGLGGRGRVYQWRVNERGLRMIRATTVVGIAWLAAGCGGAGQDLTRPDQPPVAAFAKSCQGTACSFSKDSCVSPR